MNNKELLYKKLNALRLEVDSSIVDDIKSTVDALLQEQNLQQTDVSRSAEYSDLFAQLNSVLTSVYCRLYREEMNEWFDEAGEKIQIFRKLNNGS